MSGDSVLRALDEIVPEGSILTNWILVAETTDGLSNELHFASTEGLTPWMAYGMLAAATQIVTVAGVNSDDD